MLITYQNRLIKVLFMLNMKPFHKDHIGQNGHP